jgi:hypothetical protein
LSSNRIELKLERIESNRITLKFDSIRFVRNLRYNDKKTIIEITSALKKIYPPNYEFKEREMRAWKAMLSHAGCTNITPFANDISTVSHLYFKINYND